MLFSFQNFIYSFLRSHKKYNICNVIGTAMTISNRLALVLVVAFCITNAFADFVFQEDAEQDDSRKNALVTIRMK